MVYPFLNADNLIVEYQQPIFFIGGLDSGDHQIIISNFGPEIDANNTIAGLDYLRVTSNDDKASIRPVTLGPGASSVPDNAIVVNDNDPSIAYSGDWEVLHSVPRSTFYFQNTMHSTKNPGDLCTFNFTGTAVWYFTDYFPSNAVVNISVDGGPSETVITASAGSIGLTQRLAWSKTGLKNQPHAVTITHAGNGNYASVDFFMYLPSAEGGATSSTSTSASSTSASTSTATSAAISDPLFDISQLPIGAIIGGSVGALAILALFAAFLVYMRYRRSGSTKLMDEKPQPQPNSTTLPDQSGKRTTTQFDWMRIHQSG